MAGDDTEYGAPTRREWLRYGGAVVGGGLLAGCGGQSDAGSTPGETSGGDGSTATGTPTPSPERSDARGRICVG